MGTERLTGSDGYRVRGYHVRVLRGEDAGAELRPAGGAPVKVGTAAGNTLALRDRTVSRYHLRLTATPMGVRVEDVGSTNGSWVGGARFREVLLERTAEVTVGQTTLRVEVGEGVSVETSAAEAFGRLKGRSPAMLRVFRELAFAARSKELSVLLLGETGTGKGLAARAIHEAGPRARGPFVVVDCAGLSPTLIESELFGHVAGAFTDARKARPGPFELAEGGTVFLDEVGELPLAMQPRLLRVLQDREVLRVGATRPARVDVKVLAATRRDLLEEVNAERFREDLYFRLAGEEITLPPLRDRDGDLALLVPAIVDEIVASEEGLTHRAVPPEVLDALAHRPWPGNVRELHHCVHRYLIRGELTTARTSNRVMAAASRLDVDDLLAMPYAAAVREFEQRFAQSVLDAEDRSPVRAAKRLQIDRSTLWRVLRRG